MSTYVLMRWLESAPHRYDFGIRLLTLGGVDRAYDRLGELFEAGQRILDIGCGTGALTLRAARKGATVKGIDVNPEMLEIARSRSREAGLDNRIEFQEIGVAELDGEAPESFDVVMSGLCFSELSEGELDFVLAQAKRVLKPNGRLIVSDEVKPSGVARRLLRLVVRAPVVILTYFITGQTTRALENLPGRVEKEGFMLESIRWSAMGSFIELVGRKPAVGTA